MGFEGDVKDFGLSEIFQLISVQQKSGMLLVTGEEQLAVYFREGMIISTRDRRNRGRDPLKEYLLRYGFLSRKEMNNLLHIQSEAKLDLTEILLSEKYFSQDELTVIFNEQIFESVQEVLSWPKSHYKFVTGNSLLTGVTSFASIKVDAVLMESMRRIDEIKELKRIFPTPEMIFKRAEIQPGASPEMTENEEFLYELLEEERSLNGLIASGKMPRFCVYEALRELLDKELLQIIEDHEPESINVESAPVEQTSSRGSLKPYFIAAALLLSSFFIGEFAVPWILPPGWSMTTSERKTATPPRTSGFTAVTLKEIRNRQLEKRLESALEDYLAVKGSYPLTLDVLSIRGFVSSDVVTEARNEGITYKLGGDPGTYHLYRQRR